MEGRDGEPGLFDLDTVLSPPDESGVVRPRPLLTRPVTEPDPGEVQRWERRGPVVVSSGNPRTPDPSTPGPHHPRRDPDDSTPVPSGREEEGVSTCKGRCRRHSCK